MIDFVGLIGSLAFAFVSLPILIESIRTRSSSKVSIGYLVLTLIGNVCCFSYVIYTSIATGYVLFPLFVNYMCALTIACILVLIKWKLGRRKQTNREEINRVRKTLMDEFDEFSNVSFPLFFTQEIVHLFPDIFDFDKSTIEVSPYILMDERVNGNSEDKTVDMVLHKIDICDVTASNIGNIYWITHCSLRYRNEKKQSLVLDVALPEQVKEKLVELLLTHAPDIYKDSKTPELDMMYNVLADIAAAGCLKKKDDPGKNFGETQDDDGICVE